MKFLDIRSIPGISISGVSKFYSTVNTGVLGTKMIVESDHKLYMPVDFNRLPPPVHQPLGPPPPVSVAHMAAGSIGGATGSFKYGIHPI